MHSLDAFAADKLAALERQALRRRLVETDRSGEAVVRRGARSLISFCCNDYLNLAHHPSVVSAAQAATAAYGAGAGASRLVTGNYRLLRTLEQRLARLKGSEDCVVFGAGYLANLGIVPVLCGPDDLILADALAHACLHAGARLSGATIHLFDHNDSRHLGALLTAHRKRFRHCLIITDGVFSMDGDLAPLPALAQRAADHDAWLMTDDAHGIGVLAEGRGSSFVWDRPVSVPLQMGTLSKAIGGYGGYLCCSGAVADLMRTRARTLIYSTGLPPAAAAAALAALDVIAADPALTRRPVEKAARFCRALALPAPASPIVPLILGDAARALEASALLERHGFLVTAIRPPTVPAGTARLRFTFTAAHRDSDIDRLAGLVRDRIMAAQPAA